MLPDDMNRHRTPLHVRALGGNVERRYTPEFDVRRCSTEEPIPFVAAEPVNGEHCLRRRAASPEELREVVSRSIVEDGPGSIYDVDPIDHFGQLPSAFTELIDDPGIVPCDHVASVSY